MIPAARTTNWACTTHQRTHNQNHSHHNTYIQWDLAHVSYDSNNTNTKLDTHKPPTDTQTQPFRPVHTYSLNMDMYVVAWMGLFVCHQVGRACPTQHVWVTCVSRWVERCHTFYTISTTHTIKLGTGILPTDTQTKPPMLQHTHTSIWTCHTSHIFQTTHRK